MICSTTSGERGVVTSNFSTGKSVREIFAGSAAPAMAKGTSSSVPMRSRLCGMYSTFPTTEFAIS